MPPVRIRGRSSDYLLMPARAVRRVTEPAEARALARAVGEAPGADLLLGGPHDRSSEQALAAALLDGRLLLVRLEAPPRLVDEPQARDLASLAEPLDGMPEPPAPTSWIGVEVVDQRGRPLPFFSVRVDDPAGKQHEATLDAAARARVDALGEDGSCTLTLRVPTDQGR